MPVAKAEIFETGALGPPGIYRVHGFPVTPEIRHGAVGETNPALLVDIAGPGAPASVTPVDSGTYRWIARTEHLSDAAALADLEHRLRQESDLPRLIVRLSLEGMLPIGDYADLQRRIIDLEAAVFHLDVDQSSLLARPTEADLETIDFDGVLRRCAERLRSVGNDAARTPDVRHRAEEALVELYLRVAGDQGKEAA